MAVDEKSMPFIKHLASSDRKIRTSALTTLRTFISASTASRSLSHLSHLKLWKGLFYALWMCDRPIPQQNLCTELASLLTVLPAEAVAPWLNAFYETMSREWTSIDVLRMEKFLMLVRRMFSAALVWAREANLESRRETLLGVYRAWPFEGKGDLAKVPVGLRLHVLDLWVDEADKAGMIGKESAESDEKFLGGVRELVEIQAKRSPSKPIRARAKESLADDRLPWNEQKSDEEGSDQEIQDGKGDEDGWGGFDD